MSRFSRDEETWLLGLARRAIEARLSGEDLEPSSIEQETPTAALKQPGGAFVTLERNHKLRGCVGYIEADHPLFQTVLEAAPSAAFRDPRFPPLTLEELRETSIEISVLSPLAPARPEEVTVGVHGLFVAQGGNRGLLLPQVAGEHQWSRERFLEETCRKAGLPITAWKEGASVFTFTADVFSESSQMAA